MKKIFLVSVIIWFVCTALSAEASETSEGQPPEPPFQNHVVPVLGFQMLQTDKKDFILSPSVTLQYMRVKNKPESDGDDGTTAVDIPGPDAIVVGAGYSMNHFMQPLGPDRVENTHGINVLGSVISGKNSFMCMIASGGEIPFSSIQTVTGALMYTRQFIKTDNISFVFGGGIIVGDLGLKIKDFNIYCIPLPVFSFTYTNDIFAASASVLGLPTLSLTLFPKSMLRVKGSCGIAGFKSVRDITFDCSLVCYPFIKTDTNEMIYVSAGVMNKVSNTVLRDKTKYGVQYYSVYGEFSATIVTLRCGYNFDGVNRINDEVTSPFYKGLFGSITAMYMF